MDSFLGSPGHRATLMDSRFNCFGGAGSGDFWAQEYGQSAGGCPVPNCGGYRKIKRDELPAVEIGETFVANVETGVIEIGGATEDAYQGPGDDSTAA